MRLFSALPLNPCNALAAELRQKEQQETLREPLRLCNIFRVLPDLIEELNEAARNGWFVHAVDEV